MVKNQPLDVFGLGQCSLDHIGLIPSYPEADTKCEMTELVIEGGGPVATALVALSRWSVPCAFCGVIGDDAAGAAIGISLCREGIDTGNLLTRKGAQSQIAFIVAEPDTDGRRTVFWRRPTGDPVRPEEIDMEKIRTAKIIHTDGLMMEASLAAAQTAKDAGVMVVVDAGTLREGMLDLLRLSDCVIASKGFAESLTQGGTPVDACRIMAGLGPRVAGVTLGAAGYVALGDGGLIEGTAYAVQAVDTTGCGDIFHAGFIFGLLSAWDLEKSLDFAAWAAANVSLRMGGRAGIPALDAVRGKGF